jgi:O-antigen biosynthesis protein WbqP
MGAGLSPQACAPKIARDAVAPAARVAVLKAVPAKYANINQAKPSSRVSPRKRVFDFVVAAAALIVLAPVLVVLWCLVRLTSKGPGLFWSTRAGRDQRCFAMPKFRTMTMAAPNTPRELLTDAREHVTPIGAVLRRWSLDELPQLWCILTGDMSFVGPRPLIPSDPAQIARAEFPAALGVRPGLSGLSQIRGRNLVSPRRKARLDAFYARVRSGQYDLEIFARTFAVLVSGRGFI